LLIIDQVIIDGQPVMLVRDDIFPFVGGGSKARKAVYYEQFIKEHGFNAVVTCGGVQSNHNRAIALMAARNGWKCHLCIQDDKERFYNEKGNALLSRLSGCECELINPEDTATAMDHAMKQFKDKGFTPYYIHGGGHDLPGGIAFVDAVKLLKTECDRIGYKPDYIFHASGTGSTQSGILVGLDQVGWGDVCVVGISIARQHERGKQVIVDFANMLSEYYKIQNQYNDKVIFCTDYLFGGYEQYPKEMVPYLNRISRDTGLVFDTTYSGKAFYGMMDYIDKHHMNDSKILFWHTGGIMNIMK